MLSFFFQERLAYDTSLLVPKGLDADGARTMLEQALATAVGTDDWSVSALESAYRVLAKQLPQILSHGLLTTLLVSPCPTRSIVSYIRGYTSVRGSSSERCRVAVTGRTAAPPLFDTLAVLGKERCVSRLRAALASL